MADDDKKVKASTQLTEREENQLPVVGFEGLYEVSRSGEVYSLEREVQRLSSLGNPYISTVPARELKPTLSENGHTYVSLSKGGVSRKVYVHRIVLDAFDRPCPEGMECRHLNGNPADNRLENLSWGSREENLHDRKDHGVRLNQNQNKTRCIRGHKYTPDNTYISQGFRSCKTCKREAKVNV